METKHFAWQGISLEIPRTWELSSVSGTAETGYLSLDDGERVRWECKWFTPKTKVDLNTILAQYHRQLIRQYKPKKQTVTLTPGEGKFVTPNVIGNRKYITFTLDIVKNKPVQTPPEPGKDSGKVAGLIWYCPTCSRVLLCLFYPLPGESVTAGVPVFATLSDHTESEHQNWAVYDLPFTIAKEYKLTGHNFRSGYLEFILNYKKDTLTLRRWSLANFLLNQYHLREWVYRTVIPGLKEHEFQLTDVPGETNNGHDYVLLSVNQTKKFRFRKNNPSLLSYVARFWHCVPGNKIYNVTISPSSLNTVSFDKIKVHCH